MSRMTKTLRETLLNAIVADSKFADVVVDNGVLAAIVAKEAIDVEYNSPYVIAGYDAYCEEYKKLSPALKLSIAAPALYKISQSSYSKSIMVRYRVGEDTRLQTSQVSKNLFEEGSYHPYVVDLTSTEFSKYNDKLIKMVGELEDSRNKRKEFINTVTGMLASVTTVKRLIKEFPKFEKYLPSDDHCSKDKLSKVEIKDVFSSLN